MVTIKTDSPSRLTVGVRKINTDSPSRLTVGVREKQTTTQSHNTYRRTKIILYVTIPLHTCTRPIQSTSPWSHAREYTTNQHCRSIRRTASRLHRSATLLATKTIHRNPHSSSNHLNCMTSNLACHFHLRLKGIYVSNSIPLTISSSTSAQCLDGFVFF